MAANKKPRKKYRPKRNLVDPVGFVMAGARPASDDAKIVLKIGYHSSAAALARGEGGRAEWEMVSGAINVALALSEMGVGGEVGVEICKRAQAAMLAMKDRVMAGKSMLFRAPELTAVNMALELHDEQVELATVGQVELAVAEVERRLANGLFAERTPITS